MFKIISFIICLLTCNIAAVWAGNNYSETQIMVSSPVPVAKEIVPIPQGYQTCYKVGAGWRKEKWIPEHQVCQYQNMAEGIAWVQGYWACTDVTEDGTCIVWEWNSAHWLKTLSDF